MSWYTRNLPYEGKKLLHKMCHRKSARVNEKFDFCPIGQKLILMNCNPLQFMTSRT